MDEILNEKACNSIEECGKALDKMVKSLLEIVPENVKQFREIATDMADLYQRKNADYGDSFSLSVHKYGFIAALTRLSDKFNRTEQLILNGEETGQVNDERLEDTLLDMASYAIMTVIALREMKLCSDE